MNEKNYTVTQDEWVLTTAYNQGKIAKSILEKDTGAISFCRRDGHVFRIDITQHFFPESVFLKQFGISVTEDGEYFFIQRWETGLFCFQVETGKLCWRSRRRHPYHLVVRGNTVVCQFLGECVDVLSAENGELLAHYPLGFDTYFWPLTDDYYLVGPKRGKYHIIDHTLNVCESIPVKRFNPEGFSSFILLEAGFVPNGIAINGFESSPELERACAAEGILGMDQFRYSRVIEMDVTRYH